MEIWAIVVLIVADLMYGGVLMAWLAPQRDTAGIELPAEGPCKPPEVDISGTISIDCAGVEGKAGAYLNARLTDLLRSQLLAPNDPNRPARNLADRIDDLRRQADDWTHRYRELKDRLQDSLPASHARALLQQGEIDDADAALQDLAAGQDAAGPHASSDQYNLGDAAMLRFDPAGALSHFERACRAELDNPLYAGGYAMAAYRAGYADEALRGWMQALHLYRTLAAHDPASYQPEIAATLTHLGTLYSAMGRLAEARRAIAEALAITRTLAAGDSKSYAGKAASLTRRLTELTSEPMASTH